MLRIAPNTCWRMFITVMLLGCLLNHLAIDSLGQSPSAPAGSPAGGLQSSLSTAAGRPNILWITSEDNGPQLGCYGDTYADTPNIDALAARGQMYLNAWSNAPVCAPARTTLITGMYPTSLGGQHMRSGVRLPPEFLLYPQYFKQQGYYTSNNSKEDYNVLKPKDTWDASNANAHWRKRAPGQPFFSVFNFVTTHESQVRKRPHTPIHDPSQVSIPPYHPDLPEVRQDWAQYYDQLSEMDGQVGRVLEQLRQDKLDDSTIIVYYGDHGCGLPRGKRWLYQSGLHVPLIVVVPPRYQHLIGNNYQAGAKESRLVSFVDLAPTMLSIVGLRPPEHMQGQAFLGKYAAPARQYNYGFRDRMDERVDMSRAVRDERFLYIKNFFPQRPQGTFLNYMFQTPTTQVWKAEFDAGRLNAAQSFFWQPKPAEELYDITADPYQIKNLAAESSQAETLTRMRGALKDWMVSMCDTGLLPEGEMHARSGDDDAPYTMAHDAKRFAAATLFEAADMAS
ncbi:MAG: sulfatase, partial [Pirellulaceae bacterium]|nr:sulfatase [Pirellulaceae bacterium]